MAILRRQWPWRWLMLVFPAAVVVLWPLPAWLTRHPSHGVTAADRLKATNDVRATLVQALGGLALLGGLFFTARIFRLGTKNLDLALEEQLTDRYTKAVEQLGSEKFDVRLGGIYAAHGLRTRPSHHRRSACGLPPRARHHAHRDTKPDSPDSDAYGRGPLDLHGCYLSDASLSGARRCVPSVLDIELVAGALLKDTLRIRIRSSGTSPLDILKSAAS